MGALTSTSYRFKARPWDLKKVSSTSNCSSVGCSIELNVSQNKMLRILGEDNEFTNQGWLSDKGRYNFEYLHSEKRIEEPLIVKNSSKKPNINEAMDLISNEILKGATKHKLYCWSQQYQRRVFALNNFAENLKKLKIHLKH